jgi:hypothetical protein
MLKSYCTFDYHRFNVVELENRANQVANGIYTNTSIFSVPIIAKVEFEAIQMGFGAAAADYATYSAVKKTAFTNSRSKIINSLDLLADYTDGIANGDESIIILSGFVPSSTVPQNNIPLVKIESFSLTRSNPLEVTVEIPVITGYGTVNYYCICSERTPIDNLTIVDGQIILDAVTTKIRFDYTKSKKKVYKGLLSTVTYYFYVFASNTVSVSPISDVESIIAV